MRTLAALVSGLPAHSRSLRPYTGQNYPDETLMLALILDGVNTLCWMQTEDGLNGKNRPRSVYKGLMGLDEDQKQEKKIRTFENGAAFEREWARIRGNILDEGGDTE